MNNHDEPKPNPAKQASEAELDEMSGVDATVDQIERMFDNDESAWYVDERVQKRRLTLLNGGVSTRLPVRSGEPVSSVIPVVRDALRHDQPLKRYKPEPALPPLWSATAGWADLTYQHTVQDVLGLSAGWGQDWTLTYRHGANNLTASVATVSTSALLDGDPVRVNTWHPGKTSRAGLRYLHSTDRHHAHESLFERKMLCVLDFAGADEVTSQPFTLAWHDGTRVRHHTPDFMARVDGHVFVVNTRPAERLKDRLREDASALAEVCLSRGWGHALVTGYPLPGFTTIETVETHARDHDRLGYGDAIVDLLKNFGPTPFIDVCRNFDGYIVARAILQRLIWERRVSVNLNEQLQDHSLVALPGEENAR